MPRGRRNRARARAAAPEPLKAEVADDSRKASDAISEQVEELGGGGEEVAEAAELNSDEDAQYDIEDSLFEPLVLDMVRDEDDVGCLQETDLFGHPEPMSGPEMGQGDNTLAGVEMEPDPAVPEECIDGVQDEPQVGIEVAGEMAAEEIAAVEQPPESENVDNLEFMDGGGDQQEDVEPERVSDDIPEAGIDRVPDAGSSENDFTAKREDASDEPLSEQQSDPFECTAVAEEGMKTENDIATKEESDGDEEGTVVITDLRDLCPSLPIPSGKRILESTKDIIQQAVQELIEKFLDDSENVCTAQPRATPEQDSSSELLSRSYGCTLCGISISHPGRFEIHSNSRKHLHYLRWFNGINLGRESGPFYCGVCRVSLPGRDVMASHLKSERHVCLSKLFNVDRQYATYIMDRIGGNGKVQISKSLQGSPYTTPKEVKLDRDSNAADRARDEHKPLQAQDGAQEPLKTPKSSRELDPHLSQQQVHKPSGPVDSAPPVKKNFVCDLCGVTVQRESAMEEHLRGKRHRQKVRQQQAGTAPTPAKVPWSAPVTDDPSFHKDQKQLEESRCIAETSVFASDSYEEQWPMEPQSLAQEQMEEGCMPSSEGAEATDVVREEDGDNAQTEGEAGEAAFGEEATELVSGEEGVEAACDEEFGSVEEEADGENAVDEGDTATVEEAANEESQTALGLEQEAPYTATTGEDGKKGAEESVEGGGKSDEGKHEESSNRERRRETGRHATTRDSHRHSGTGSKREPVRDSRRHSRDDRSRDARGKEAGAGTRDTRNSRKDNSRPDSRGDSRDRPNRECKDSSRSDSRGDELKGGSREVRGTRDRKRSASSPDARTAHSSRDLKARDASSRDTRNLRGPIRRRSSLTRRDTDVFRRRASPSPDRPLSSKKPKYSCLTCKVAIFSDRDYKDHFDSRRHRLEVERREKKDAEQSRRRSPSPRTYRRRDRSRSPIEHRITAPLVIPSHPTHQTHDPSSFLQAQWLTPAAFVPVQQHPQQNALQHLQQLPQQQHIPHHLQQQAQQQLGITGLPQAAAPALPLESYTERRPIVAGTLDNMLLLQQQLLSLASRNNAAGALPMQQDYQNGLRQNNPTLQSQQEKQLQQYKGTTSFSQPQKPAQQQTQFLDKSSSGRGQTQQDYKATTGIHFRSSTADGSVNSYAPQKTNASSQNVAPHVTAARENYGQMFQQTTTNPSSRYGNVLDTSLAGKNRPNVQSAALQRRQQMQYSGKTSNVSSGYQFMQKRY